jgi:endo-1,4-beta-xylanase
MMLNSGRNRCIGGLLRCALVPLGLLVGMASGCGGGSSATAPGAAPAADDPPPSGSMQEILQTPHDWSRFSGTVWDGRQLTVIPLDRTIRPKTTGKRYFNPPINLMGPRLEFSSAFSVAVEVDVSQHPAKAAYVDLYGSVPIGYDEWRIDGRNVRIGVAGGTVSFWVNMVRQGFTGAAPAGRVRLGVEKRNTTLIFSVDDREVGRVDEAASLPVFVAGQLFFGLDAELGGGFAVTSIQALATRVADNAAERVKAHAVPPDSLRALAASMPNPVPIGTAINADALLADPQYGRTLAEQFSMVTPEMHFKFQAIHPRPDRYAFAEADALVEFARLNGLRVHGHTLVWHEALPQWVWDLYQAGARDALRQALLDHIAAVVSRYKGRIPSWDTLNEIFSTESREPYGLRSDAEDQNNLSVWYKTFGLEIYVDALRKVKEIDPTAENWINEFGIDQTAAADKLANMIAFARHVNGLGHGRLVDGIGFQSHNYDPVGDPSVASELLVAMTQVIQQAGLKVRISELDVSGASSRPTLFSDKLEACLRLRAAGCTGTGMWGFTDRYGSMSSPQNAAGDTNHQAPNWGAWYVDSLIFDSAYRPRSAVAAMQGVLRNPPGPVRSEASALPMAPRPRGAGR